MVMRGFITIIYKKIGSELGLSTSEIVYLEFRLKLNSKKKC